MSNEIALCKCGIDMSNHSKYDSPTCGVDFDGEAFDALPELYRFGHEFEASGTKHRCARFVYGYLCAMPQGHRNEGVPCGPLTGKKLY